ncbi:MAG: hypothetical protein ACYDH5_02905 [Acidimicrobiales bacterium]
MDEITSRVAAVIAAYTPRGVPPEAAAFAREVVALAAPATATKAKAWLFAASRIGAFAVSVGLEALPEVVLSASVIERFISSVERTVSGPTRRTLRGNLRSLAARLSGAPRPAHLSRERAKKPYSPGEIASYLALADAQPTEARRLRAVGLICLGAGAGLTGADLRGVRGQDVVARSGGVVVEVTGRRPRVVPVLACYHKRLLRAAAHVESGYVVGGIEAARKNVTTPLIASLAGGADLARIEVGRLRSTWLVAIAKAIGLEAFMPGFRRW